MSLPVRQADLAASDARRSSPAAALFAVGAFVLYVALAMFGGGGRTLSITYPLGCLLVAAFAYLRHPTIYLAFTTWTWLLTPFLRRVFDLRYGYHPPSSLLLGPLLASLLAVVTLVRFRRSLRNSAYLPFLIAIAALVYAFLIGIVRQSAAAAAYDLVNWLAPLLFGLHVALLWREFPRLRDTVAKTMLLGLLVTAVYGIYQFVQPPTWDRVWVVSAEMASVGIPLPFFIRVFSTMNAPGPFSVFLIAALLVGLASPQRWRALPLALGLVALILTKGRSAWAALFIGAVILQLLQPVRSLPRQWLALLGVLLLALPVVTQPKVIGVLNKRAATVTNLAADPSYQARMSFGRFALKSLASNPAGNGLGALGGAGKLLTGGKAGLALDSAPLEIYSAMGWIGGTLYMMSLIAIVLPIMRSRKARFDSITSAAAASVVAIMATSLFGNVFTGVSGFIFWMMVGIATAGRSWGMATQLLARFANHPGLSVRTAAVPASTAA